MPKFHYKRYIQGFKILEVEARDRKEADYLVFNCCEGEVIDSKEEGQEVPIEFIREIPDQD